MQIDTITVVLDLGHSNNSYLLTSTQVYPACAFQQDPVSIDDCV